VAISQLQGIVKENLNLPPFEEWVKSTAQMRIFQ
jgi:hypothetical protein